MLILCTALCNVNSSFLHVHFHPVYCVCHFSLVLDIILCYFWAWLLYNQWVMSFTYLKTLLILHYITYRVYFSNIAFKISQSAFPKCTSVDIICDTVISHTVISCTEKHDILWLILFCSCIKLLLNIA